MKKPSLAVSEQQIVNAATLLFPSLVRYHDDYTDKNHSFSEFGSNEWRIVANGSASIIKFSIFDDEPQLQKVIKAFTCNLLQTATPATARNYVQGLSLIESHQIIDLLTCELSNCRALWDLLLAQQMYLHSYMALKSLLRYAAANRLGTWTPSYLSFISASLPLPSRDKYSAIRSGEVFIDIRTEAKIVRWIYDISKSVKSVPTDELIDAGMLICNYQFAMRPKQIGLLRNRDMRVYKSASGDVSVHLTFHMLKQRTSSKRPPLVRKIKREWVTVFLELSERTQLAADSHLFGILNAATVSMRLKNVITRITGQGWTPTDLRHSGAMRQVDAGANAEELAEFMGHSSLDSGIVYYDTSATQAERVNRALGISHTYKTVAQIGNQGFISPQELSRLKAENQIGGVPHGFPITGIGACTTGQPTCPYNPITACYGCPKFLATTDVEMHKQVLSDFRQIVQFFYHASRGEDQSSAYLQLTQTINEVQSVIASISNDDEFTR